MKKNEHSKEQDAHTTKEVKEQLEEKPKQLEAPKVTTPTETPEEIPSNLNLGEYRSLETPDIGKPTTKESTAGQVAGSLLGRIKEAVASDGDAEEKGEDPRRPASKKQVTKDDVDDFQDLARMVLSPLLIMAVGTSLGEVCEPTPEEANQFVDPLARIIARHVPIPDHMSADLVDILAMASVGIMWYMRVNNDLPWNRGDDNRRPPPDKPSGDGDGQLSEEDDQRVTQLLTGTSVEEFQNGYR